MKRGLLLLSMLCMLTARAALHPAAAGARRTRRVARCDADFEELGPITVYQPTGTPRGVALLISGDGGWNRGVIDMARAARRTRRFGSRGRHSPGDEARSRARSGLHLSGNAVPGKLAHTLERACSAPSIATHNTRGL